MTKFITSIPRSEIRLMTVEDETMISGTYDNFLLTFQKPDGGNWGGLTLTKLMIDAHLSKKNKTKPVYRLNETPVGKSSCLYLFRCRNANKGLFKIGRAAKCIKRLSAYKTALPKDHEILIISVLVIPDPAIIVAIEKVLIANLRHFANEYPTKLQPLRMTEHFTTGKEHFGEALTLRTFISLASHVCRMYPSIKAHMHLYGKAAWNTMLTLPNIGFTPRLDVVPKTWKGMTPIEKQLSDAEKSLVTRADDEGFTKKQLNAKIDFTTEEVFVDIEPLVI